MRYDESVQYGEKNNRKFVKCKVLKFYIANGNSTIIDLSKDLCL